MQDPASGLRRIPLKRTSQNAQNAHFTKTEFSEIKRSSRTRTLGRVMRSSGLFASYASACISERVSAHSTSI